jgi:hypothetical protein
VFKLILFDKYINPSVATAVVLGLHAKASELPQFLVLCHTLASQLVQLFYENKDIQVEVVAKVMSMVEILNSSDIFKHLLGSATLLWLDSKFVLGPMVRYFIISSLFGLPLEENSLQFVLFVGCCIFGQILSK